MSHDALPSPFHSGESRINVEEIATINSQAIEHYRGGVKTLILFHHDYIDGRDYEIPSSINAENRAMLNRTYAKVGARLGDSVGTVEFRDDGSKLEVVVIPHGETSCFRETTLHDERLVGGCRSSVKYFP